MNEKMYKFIILGKPKAKQSTKFRNAGTFIQKYTPKDIVEYSNWVRHSFYKEYPNHLPSELIDYQLRMNIDVFFSIPKSFSKTKTKLALDGKIRPTIKPDWDNISKNICDALNGIAYPDDKAIVSGSVNKYYSNVDYVNVEIRGTKL